MNDPIKKLREDVFDIIGFAPGEVLLGPETQMFHDHARIVRKVMHRIAAFAEEWEAKEVALGQLSGRWYDPRDLPLSTQHTTILVPRKKPGLREAAAELLAWMDVGYHDKSIGTLRKNLAAALKEDE